MRQLLMAAGARARGGERALLWFACVRSLPARAVLSSSRLFMFHHTLSICCRGFRSGIRSTLSLLPALYMSVVEVFSQARKGEKQGPKICRQRRAERAIRSRELNERMQGSLVFFHGM